MTNPFFNVTRSPLTTIFNGEEIEVGKDALINSENGNILGVVTPTYKVVTNDQVNDLVNRMFDLNNVPVMKSVDHLNGKTNRWTRELILDGERFTHKVDGNDTLKTRVLVSNGYDTFTPVSVSIAAWRMVCSNGMMGWGNVFSSYYRHMTEDVVGLLKDDFERHNFNLQGSVELWNEWSRIPFGQNQFNEFIDMVSVNPEDAIISAKQGDGIKALYEPVMNRFNETQTLYGAYNVLTAIQTHHTKAHKGSNLFSAKYNKMQKITNRFYKEFAEAA